jgi:hypothetical protein
MRRPLPKSAPGAPFFLCPTCGRLRRPRKKARADNTAVFWYHEKKHGGGKEYPGSSIEPARAKIPWQAQSSFLSKASRCLPGGHPQTPGGYAKCSLSPACVDGQDSHRVAVLTVFRQRCTRSRREGAATAATNPRASTPLDSGASSVVHRQFGWTGGGPKKTEPDTLFSPEGREESKSPSPSTAPSKAAHAEQTLSSWAVLQISMITLPFVLRMKKPHGSGPCGRGSHRHAPVNVGKQGVRAESENSLPDRWPVFQISRGKHGEGMPLEFWIRSV